MPWREGLVIALGLMVGGCFLSAYQVASWTATGLSYVLSGKGVGDHALSLAMNQDCATWRVLQGKEICVDYGSDFESSWDAMASTWKLPGETEGADKDLVAVDSGVPVPNTKTSEITAQIASVPTADLAPVNFGATVTQDADEPVLGLEFGGIYVPEWVVGPRQESAWRPNSFAPRGIDLDELVLIKPSREVLDVVSEEMVRVKSADPAIYLVMGSFRVRANAERLGGIHTSFKTKVSKAEVGGRTMYRLLAGPVEKALLTRLRNDLSDAGVRHSWAVKLCRGGLTPPPCRAPVQQAKLP